MKKLLILLTFFTISLHCFSQDCNGDLVKLINKEETFTASCDQMFILSSETFASYYYAKLRMDTLLNIIPKQKELVDSLYQLSQEHIDILNKEISLSNVQLQNRSEAIQRLQNTIQTCVNNNSECITNYSKLSDKFRAMKKKRDNWRLSTGALGGVVAILFGALLIN